MANSYKYGALPIIFFVPKLNGAWAKLVCFQALTPLQDRVSQLGTLFGVP